MTSQDRQAGNVGRHVPKELQIGGCVPGLLDAYVLEVIAHELTNARAAVNVGNDLQQKVRLLHASP